MAAAIGVTAAMLEACRRSMAGPNSGPVAIMAQPTLSGCDFLPNATALGLWRRLLDRKIITHCSENVIGRAARQGLGLVIA